MSLGLELLLSALVLAFSLPVIPVLHPSGRMISFFLEVPSYRCNTSSSIDVYNRQQICWYFFGFNYLDAED